MYNKENENENESVVEQLGKGDKVCSYGIFETGLAYAYLEEIVDVTKTGNYKLKDDTILYKETLKVRGSSSRMTSTFYPVTPERIEQIHAIRSAIRLRNNFGLVKAVRFSDICDKDDKGYLKVNKEKVQKVSQALQNLLKVIEEVRSESEHA